MSKRTYKHQADVRKQYLRVVDRIGGETSKLSREVSSVLGTYLPSLEQSVNANDLRSVSKRIDTFSENAQASDLMKRALQQAYAPENIRTKRDAMKATLDLATLEYQYGEVKSLAQELYDAGYDEQKHLTDFLNNASLSTDELKNIVRRDFYEQTYQQRAVDNATLYRQRLDDVIREYELAEDKDLGDSIIHAQHLTEDEKSDSLRYRSERLATSEDARVRADVHQELYEKDENIIGYRFVSELNENTCETCGGLHGKVYLKNEFVKGSTAPPIHPHCACSTEAVYEV